MADAMEEVAGLSPEPARRSAGTELLRIALTPVALAASVVGSVAERVRHRPPPAEV